MTAPSTPAPGGSTDSSTAGSSTAGSTGTAAPETVDAVTGSVGTPAPSTTVAAGPLGQDEIDALQAALGAEQAAVFAYGLVAAYDQDDKNLVNQVLLGHRTRRDLTEERLSQGGATPVENAAAYQPATPVTDQGTARLLAQDIEFDCAAAWRVVIGSTDQADLRGFALAGLSDAAVRQAQWKVLAGVVPSTVPFPGQG